MNNKNAGSNFAFLLSMPRAGSTLLSLLLGNHPEIHCPPEPWLQLLLAEYCARLDDDQLPYDEYLATLASGDLLRSAAGLAENRTRLTEAFRNLFSMERRESGAAQFANTVYSICTSQTGKRFFVDKTPRNYRTLDFLDRTYPAAKKIVLKRNPLDIALSYKTTWAVPIGEMVGQVATSNTVDFAKGLFELERYASSQRPDIFVLAYEDLVEDPEGCLRRICKFLGVEFSPSMLAFHKNHALLATQKASAVGDRKVLVAGRSVDKASLGGWRNGLSFDEKSLLAAFLGKDIFDRYGYQQTIQDLLEDGVRFPSGTKTNETRSTALGACRTILEESFQLGHWGYLIACAGISADNFLGVTELLAQSLRRKNPAFHGSSAELILDIVRRYQLERALHLSHIDTYTDAFKKVDIERSAHLHALDELTIALKASYAEQAAHLGRIEMLKEWKNKTAVEGIEATANEVPLLDLGTQHSYAGSFDLGSKRQRMQGTIKALAIKTFSGLPTISIVTPCLNQVAYVEQTLQSIHGQGYPYLEHVVMDGGSTDGSLVIIRRYADRLVWKSEPDGGQYQAITSGFAKTTGEIMGWLNSDDIYLPGALRAVGEIFRDFPDVEWLTTRFPMGIKGSGALIKMGCFSGFSKYHFLRGDYLPACGWEAMGFIQQESTFWRRRLWDHAGGSFREGLNFAGDFELWSRFFEHAQLFGVDVPLACFRRHEAQKTSVAFQKYLHEAKDVFERAGGRVFPPLAQKARMRLIEACGTSLGWRRCACKIGLINGARNITYDWGRSCWAKEH